MKISTIKNLLKVALLLSLSNLSLNSTSDDTDYSEEDEKVEKKIKIFRYNQDCYIEVTIEEDLSTIGELKKKIFTNQVSSISKNRFNDLNNYEENRQVIRIKGDLKNTSLELNDNIPNEELELMLFLKLSIKSSDSKEPTVEILIREDSKISDLKEEIRKNINIDIKDKYLKIEKHLENKISKKNYYSFSSYSEEKLFGGTSDNIELSELSISEGSVITVVGSEEL